MLVGGLSVAVQQPELAQLVVAHLADQAFPVGRAVDAVVVADHDLPVGRQVHVDLYPSGSGLDALLDASEGVLGAEHGAASVGDHDKFVFRTAGAACGLERRTEDCGKDCRGSEEMYHDFLVLYLYASSAASTMVSIAEPTTRKPVTVES